MIQVTRLDGAVVFINETNIQWIENLPDTAITFLSGARMIVRDSPEDIARKVNQLVFKSGKAANFPQESTTSDQSASNS
jgi:flagellar protein FlbD